MRAAKPGGKSVCGSDLWLAAVVTAALLGCAGTALDVGADQGNGGQNDGATVVDNGGGVSTSRCEVECVPSAFKAKCNLCHGKATQLGGPLDLETPGFTARLKDQPSTHQGIVPPPPAGACPEGDRLIDTANMSESWLLKKLNGSFGNCGTAMPQALVLTPEEHACLNEYVACVAGEPLL